MVMEDGRVVAWATGLEGNSRGQLNVPAMLQNVASVAAGETFSMALTAQGEIVVWGSLEAPPELKGFKAIAAGHNHALSLREDGAVMAWGNNQWGQIDVPRDLRNVVSIAAGRGHSLAVTAEGHVIAWGENSSGQCNVPAEAKDIVQVSAGWGHSMALTRDGQVLVWGGNTHRQLLVPDSIQGRITTVRAGWWHSFAILKDGSLAVWGGQSAPNPNNSPHLLPADIKRVIGLAAGEQGVVAAYTDGRVVSWEYSEVTSALQYAPAPTGLKVLGPSLHTELGPERVGPKVASAGHARIVLRADGTVIAWGEPNVYAVPEELSDLVDVIVDDYGRYIMALTANGRVVVWGKSTGEQPNVLHFVPLGDDARLEQTITVPVDLPSVKSVAGGRLGAIALTQEGTVVGWSFSTVRTGARTISPPKVETITGLTDIVQIAAGREHFLALRADGTIFAWGNNDYGQAKVPPGGEKFRSIAAWSNTSMAIRLDGSLVAWGEGPLPPNGLSNVAAVAGTLALKDDGTVVGWGSAAHLVPEVVDAIAISPWMVLRSDGTVVTWSWRNQVGESNIPTGLRVK